MKSVKMDRVQLLDIVRENCKKHVVSYLESIEDYKLLVVKVAAMNSKLAKSADMEQFKLFKGMPSAPMSYEDSYNRAIRMLELSVESTIDIDEGIFNQLVLDEWSWKRGFLAATAMYKTGSAGL